LPRRRHNRALATLLVALAALGGGLAWAEPASAGRQERKLRAALSEAMRAAGGGSGAYVGNMTEGGRLFAKRAGDRRTLASNTKLYSTAATLGRFGPEERLETQVRGAGELTAAGAWLGDLYLVGGADPTFGSRSFARDYGSEASVEALATALDRAGLRRVMGRIRGDESRHDSRRGGPASDYQTSGFVGPLSALSFNRGESGGGFQSNPPKVAARQLTRALERRGIGVRDGAGTGTAPPAAAALAGVSSPPLAGLVRQTNKPSDNFFAEMLAKELGTSPGRGTTDRGANRAQAFAADLGSRARILDGSGLARGNRASPRAMVKLLVRLDARPSFEFAYPAFRSSLPVAGRDGTLSDRMRGKAAQGRCRAKTGTLPDVSVLSGYCRSRGGDRIAFSFLMSGIDVEAARDLQDRMANAIARFRG